MDAALSDELNALLRTAEKRTRGFLPPPEHLRADPDVATGAAAPTAQGLAATASTEGEAAATSTSEVATPTSPAPKSHPMPHAAGTAGHWRLEGDALAQARQRMRAVAEARCLTKVPRLSAWFERVDGAVQAADAAEERVEAIKCRVDTLADITSKVHGHSDALSANASALMARKARLERTLSAIAAAMRHFNLVDELMTKVSLPDLDATASDFPTLLSQLEDTAVYLSRVQHYKSAKTYSSRLSMAYQRAMMALRDCIVTKVQAAAADVIASREYSSLFRDAKNAPHVGVAAMNSEASESEIARPASLRGALERVNALFWAKLSELEPQLRLLEARCDASEAEMFVNDCFDAYGDQRARLVTPLLNEYTAAADSTEEDREGPGGVEAANIRLLLRNVATALAEERQLFDTVWLSEDVPSGAFDGIAAEVADAAYQRFRAALLRTDELEELAAMCAALVEYIGNSNAGDNARAQATPERKLAPELSRAAPVVVRMLQDAQERIVFRTSIFIRHKVAAFPDSGDELWQQCLAAAGAAAAAEDEPKATEDAAASASTAALPAPVAAAVENVEEGAATAMAASASDASVPEAATSPRGRAEGQEEAAALPAPVAAAVENVEEGAATAMAASASDVSAPEAATSPTTIASPTIITQQQAKAADAAAAAFQPLARCVYLLNVLYPAVSAGVFAVFADECVHLTVELLAKAAKMVKQAGDLATTGAAGASGATGIAAEVSRSLPALYAKLFLVRHLLRLREALTRFDVNLTVEEKGLNVSALVQRKLELFSRSRESKRDVETELRVACEGAIEAMRTLVAKPIADRMAGIQPTSGAADVSDATAAAVNDSATVASALKSDLRGFITAPATRAVLWRPVRSAAQAAFKELDDKIKSVHADFAAPQEALAALEAL
eukprot:CAMPEP_0174880728 /NCGR_PEP_ID=MMETSP1114-20130205/83905_1 /TAXON_ID=312471 /ORGANISM="Neobodo designis, Strain CCAP 1951/1" /LENGTH=906 /DNA_ID=CAMNT_0016116121 /DNA_START=36 /DNA_END=2757 /DNA_ORIENTATION=-